MRNKYLLRNWVIGTLVSRGSENMDTLTEECKANFGVFATIDLMFVIMDLIFEKYITTTDDKSFKMR